MSRHASPAAEQRCQRRASSNGPPALHTPSSALSSSPIAAVPVTFGATSGATGTICATGGGAESTTAVAPDVDAAEPSAFVALTTTTSVEPTSSAATSYVVPVAPAMSAHAGVASQRCH